LARYIDVTVLGQFKDGTTYTWILSSLGFAASVLFGVRAGRILMSDKPQRTRLLLLVGMGFGCLALGAVWGIFFPIIKHIWTSSMALWAAGWSFLLLALFYGVIDVLGYRRWAFGFVVIGANALITYMIAEPFNGVAVDFVVGLFHNSGLLIHFLAAVAVFSATWAALYFLYRKRWFLRI
jgi:predicted acyltransferase